jgi:hypothetical protein
VQRERILGKHRVDVDHLALLQAQPVSACCSCKGGRLARSHARPP